MNYLYKPIKDKYVKPNTDPKWINNLPFIDVANKWNVSVRQYCHPKSTNYGFYDSEHRIIWLYSQADRVFLHELSHLSDDRNHMMSYCVDPEIYLDPSIMLQYVQDEVVAEMSAVRLLMNMGIKPRSAGYGNAQIYVKEMCNLGGYDPEIIMTSLENRIEKAMKNIA